jgi:serine kinase of HPr protein (carbohydrate metabolism regulator)
VSDPQEVVVHASCVAIGGRAVLIAGASGSGKSDLAYRLIDRGAVLVSDDYTALRAEAGRLLARPPERIAGRIELRGVGILTLPFASDMVVALVVDLELAPERLAEPAGRSIGGVEIPSVGLSALEPSAPLKVEAALRLHGLTLP